MHWLHWALIVLLIICAIPIALLLGYISFVIWFNIRLRRRKYQLVEVQDTEYGLFGKLPLSDGESAWASIFVRGGREVAVVVPEADGSPDPDALKKLPAILVRLPRLEKKARHKLAAITRQHRLESIDMRSAVTASPAPPGSTRDVCGAFVLGFSLPPEESDVVFVSFAGEMIVEYVALDESRGEATVAKLAGSTVRMLPQKELAAATVCR